MLARFHPLLLARKSLCCWSGSVSFLLARLHPLLLARFCISLAGQVPSLLLTGSVSFLLARFHPLLLARFCIAFAGQVPSLRLASFCNSFAGQVPPLRLARFMYPLLAWRTLLYLCKVLSPIAGHWPKTIIHCSDRFHSQV